MLSIVGEHNCKADKGIRRQAHYRYLVIVYRVFQKNICDRSWGDKDKSK